MSGILKRTVLIDDSDGVMRPHDFSMVLTELGMCAEPSCGIFMRGFEKPSTTTQPYDATDQISRVDEIKRHSLDKYTTMFGEWCHGTTMHPRTGR